MVNSVLIMTQGVISYYSFTGLCIWKIFLTVATVKDAKSSPHKLNSLRPRGAIPTNLRSYESPVKTKPWSILFESGLAEVTKSVVYQLIIKNLNSNETTKKLCWDAGSWDRKLALFFFFCHWFTFSLTLELSPRTLLLVYDIHILIPWLCEYYPAFRLVRCQSTRVSVLHQRGLSTQNLFYGVSL